LASDRSLGRHVRVPKEELPPNGPLSIDPGATQDQCCRGSHEALAPLSELNLAFRKIYPKLHSMQLQSPKGVATAFLYVVHDNSHRHSQDETLIVRLSTTKTC
jgi:hypothetical protein